MRSVPAIIYRGVGIPPLNQERSTLYRQYATLTNTDNVSVSVNNKHNGDHDVPSKPTILSNEI